MRSEAPPLLPIFRSRHQAELLTLLVLHPDREYTLTDLAAWLGVPLSTLQREVNRLAAARLISERRVGQARLLSANADSRYHPALTELLTMAFGPHTVVAEEFADLPGAEAVAVFGSWAARYRGEPGPPPNDVDVLVLGEPDRTEVYAAADRARDRLRLDVNPVLRSVKAWRQPADGLVAELRTAAVVWVVGEDPAEGGAASGKSGKTSAARKEPR
jgi:predicted nucleotidyltransferase